MCSKNFFIGMALLVVSMAYAQLPAPSPLPKHGDCPSDYLVAGNECVPGSAAKFAVAKSGTCPDGYNADGNYCVASTSARLAIRRAAMSCPNGYESMGDYCLSTK